MNAAAIDNGDSDRADFAADPSEQRAARCSRPVANCVFLIFAFLVLVFFTLFIRPERPPPIASVLPENDVIRYLRKAAEMDQVFQEEFHLRLRHVVVSGGGVRSTSTTSDLGKMLMEHDEAQKLLMHKNGIKSRMLSAKGRYAREVILHRLANQMDMWQAYEALLKTIACERTRALNYFIVNMMAHPLETRSENLKVVLERYNSEVFEIENVVPELDKRADRLWTNFRKHNTSGVSPCCLKDGNDYEFLFKKYTDLYVESTYLGDSCLPSATICSEKHSRDEFARWPFMITIFAVVFLVSVFNSRKAETRERDAEDALQQEDPFQNDLAAVAIPPFVFRPAHSAASTSAAELSAAKETDPPPAYTPPHSPPPYASVISNSASEANSG